MSNMRKIHKRVKVSNMRYKLNEGLLWNLADKLAPHIKKLVKDEHLKGSKLNGRDLPDYSEYYVTWKADALGVSPASISPNLELSGELHDGAITQVAHQAEFALVRYSLSELGAEHLRRAQVNSNKVWEAYDRIAKKHWLNIIMPEISESMENYREHFPFLISIKPE